jgi:TRAP transporter TAXI family solute receptor
MRAALLVLALLCAPVPAAALTFFSVGSGDLDGGYFRAASALCDRVNRAERGVLRCSPETTPGSLYNLAALRAGQLDVALVQSDWQRHAYSGTSIFADAGPMPALRSVMSLFPEPFTLVARRDAGIADFEDLRGKRVDFGHPSSGRHATMREALVAFGLTRDDFAAVLELPTGSVAAELCAGRIDATVLIVGHPNAAVARALAECDAELVPVTGPAVAALASGPSGYTPMSIPAGTYPGQRSAVPTFGVVATVVALASTPDPVVAALVTETLDGIIALGQATPLLGALNPADMRSRGLSAPLHPAAEAAFAAAGD